MFHTPAFEVDLPLAILDVIPNPVLVKSANLKYSWINAAFEELFDVRRADVIGHLDSELFPDRQVSQCNGGDLRVLETGTIDEAYETVFTRDGEHRETLTRKSRLTLPDGSTYLVGVMHDLTDMMKTNADLETSKIKLEEQAQQLALLANTDALTGALTRRALYAQVDRLMVETPSYGLLLLDIDHFKTVNDRYGHAAGDAALVHFCRVIRSVLRETDVFARMGGEEFVAFLPGASASEMTSIGQRMTDALRHAPLSHNGTEIVMTVSVGGIWHSTAPSEGNTNGRLAELEGVLAEADSLLYRAKVSGRDRLVTADSE